MNTIEEPTVKKALIALVMAGTAGLFTFALWADEREHEDSAERMEYPSRDETRTAPPGAAGGSARSYLADPAHALYKQECGSCHFSYPATFLPAASWQRVMATLGNHFGDNAELDAATAQKIGDYLDRNSAGRSPGDYSERTWRATRGQPAMLRITETDYFRGQHHEIPAKMVTGNPEVKSFSRCQACHTRAEGGSFNEHEVRIPGYGRFND
jgi:hypothetical protein